LIKRAKKAAEQAARANKIVIPGIKKNTEPDSVSHYALTVMKNIKLKNYDRCVDNRILGFKDKKYIVEQCKYIYGESLGNKCDRKSQFCGMCCSHHAGLSYRNHYKKCFNKCENLIRGVSNTSKTNDKKDDEKEKKNKAKDDKNNKKKN